MKLTLHSDSVISDNEYHKFQNLVYKLTGISFNECNRSSLETRILERMRAINFKNTQDYYEFVCQNDEELKFLLSTITTNLTRFFRTPSHFEALEKLVLPALIDYKEHLKTRRKIITVWSAGCSTGEEAYSLAMSLHEWLPEDFSFRITATDISLPSLYTAQEGRYATKRCQDIPYEFLKKYFYKSKNSYVAKIFLKESIIFDYNNLVLDTHYKKFDIIFCRNVMIYFDQKSQKILVDNLFRAMNPFSFLFLGHTESLESIYNQLPPYIENTSYITVYKRDKKS